MPKINVLLNYLKNNAWLTQTWSNAREKKKNSFSVNSPYHNYEDTCAATASYRYMQAGLIDKFFMLTSDLSDHMIKNGWRRRLSFADIKPGDAIFMQDYNHNKKPDHVVIAVTVPLDPPANYIMVVDNGNEGLPYKRNLGKGGYTAADYALYYPEPVSSLSPNQLNNCVDILQALRTLYSHQDLFDKISMESLNEFSNSPVIKAITTAAKEKLNEATPKV